MGYKEKLHRIWLIMYDCLNQFGPIYIAGGAVRDTLMGKDPKDYDVFVLNSNSFESIENEIAICLKDYPEIDLKLSFHTSEPFLIKTIRLFDSDIQIMVNPAKDINNLLSTFDWNTAMFAYGAEGFIQKESIENIVMGKELKLNKVTFPYSTLRRGYRFSERFGMILPSAAIHQIIDEIQKCRNRAVENIYQI